MVQHGMLTRRWVTVILVACAVGGLGLFMTAGAGAARVHVTQGGCNNANRPANVSGDVVNETNDTFRLASRDQSYAASWFPLPGPAIGSGTTGHWCNHASSKYPPAFAKVAYTIGDGDRLNIEMFSTGQQVCAISGAHASAFACRIISRRYSNPQLKVTFGVSRT